MARGEIRRNKMYIYLCFSENERKIGNVRVVMLMEKKSSRFWGWKERLSRWWRPAIAAGAPLRRISISHSLGSPLSSFLPLFHQVSVLFSATFYLIFWVFYGSTWFSLLRPSITGLHLFSLVFNEFQCSKWLLVA